MVFVVMAHVFLSRAPVGSYLAGLRAGDASMTDREGTLPAPFAGRNYSVQTEQIKNLRLAFDTAADAVSSQIHFRCPGPELIDEVIADETK
jgi:hypothetical protein